MFIASAAQHASATWDKLPHSTTIATRMLHQDLSTFCSRPISEFIDHRHSDIRDAEHPSRPVPEFLEQYKDASGQAVFDDDKSDDEAESGGAPVGDGGWGNEETTGGAPAAADDAWV